MFVEISELPHLVISINKYFMKKIDHTYRWIVFLFFTFLCSCTNEDNNQVLFLKQIVEVSADGTSNTTVLNYNGNKIASIDNVEMHSDFYYTANLITKIEKFDKVEKHSNTLEYNYNNGELVKIISSDNYVINYVHNNDGTVSYEKVTKDANNNDIIVFHGMLSSLVRNCIILFSKWKDNQKQYDFRRYYYYRFN